MISDKEYDGIDYYLQKSKLYDSGFYLCQRDNGECYFHDEEFNGEDLTLEEGLQLIYESMVFEYVSEYPIEIKEGLKQLFYRVLGVRLEI